MASQGGCLMPIQELPIIGEYNVQRFPQFCPESTANWYLLPNENGKKKMAMYPTLGRHHVNFLGQNRLIFASESRGLFKSMGYWYNVVGNTIWRVDRFFNQVNIAAGTLATITGNIFFTSLTVANSGTTATAPISFAIFADGQKMYVYQENTGTFSVVSDRNAPSNPLYLATFGNRIVVSQAGSSLFYLSVINLLNGSGVFNPATCFTINSASLFASEDDTIGQMAVLHNTLYIFTNYQTGIWSNTPAVFTGTGASFPFKKNTTFSFDFGINDPLSLDVDFGFMAWEARNRGGLTQFMISAGAEPENITSKAIDVLLQNNANLFAMNPFLVNTVEGFLYSYENTVFYRVSLGRYMDVMGIVDYREDAFTVEYNFDLQKWHKVIEVDGERNRVQKSVYFAGRHFVSIDGEGTVYEMNGQFYTNEHANPAESNPQAPDAYIVEPFRYERVTPIIFEEDYAEFETEYVEIDFVWGDHTSIFSIDAFANAIYIVDETSTPTNPVFLIDESSATDPVYIIDEAGNTPQLNEPTYNALFKPSIVLYWSDDGGITFNSADNREFSQLGVYKWRMRWYQLGPSRNRVYKLVCISPSPIVVLGGVMNMKRISGGAN
jgi:hypothetical protein